MIGDELTRKVLGRMQQLEAWAPRFRIATVTDDAPLTITLGAGATPIVDVKALRSYAPVIGDIVACVNYASDLLVLGAIGTTDPWHGLALAGTWVNVTSGYMVAQYRKDSAGTVHVDGFVTGGGASSIGILPAGYRPASSLIRAQYQNGAFSSIEIRNTGEIVQLTGAARTNQTIACTFKAEL